jgi:hypothetical protein
LAGAAAIFAQVATTGGTSPAGSINVLVDYAAPAT